MTALHWAAMQKQCRAGYRAAPRRRERSRRDTPRRLHAAASSRPKRERAVIEPLLAGRRRRQRARTSNGATPLMLAAGSGTSAPSTSCVGARRRHRSDGSRSAGSPPRCSRRAANRADVIKPRSPRRRRRLRGGDDAASICGTWIAAASRGMLFGNPSPPSAKDAWPRRPRCAGGRAAARRWRRTWRGRRASIATIRATSWSTSQGGMTPLLFARAAGTLTPCTRCSTPAPT